MNRCARASLTLLLVVAACKPEGTSPPALIDGAAPAVSAPSLSPPSLPPPLPPDTAHVLTTCPLEMAPIPVGGCIDRWEASAGAGSLGEPDGKRTTMVARSVSGVRPVSDVSVEQASRACANAHKHLCSEAEWRSSCKDRRAYEHPDVQAYPYGVGYEPGRCNDYAASEKGKRRSRGK